MKELDGSAVEDIVGAKIVSNINTDFSSRSAAEDNKIGEEAA